MDQLKYDCLRFQTLENLTHQVKSLIQVFISTNFIVLKTQDRHNVLNFFFNKHTVFIISVRRF